MVPIGCWRNFALKTDKTRQLIAIRRLHPPKLRKLDEGGNLNFLNTCFPVWRNLVSQNRRSASADILWLAYGPAFLASCLPLLTSGEWWIGTSNLYWDGSQWNEKIGKHKIKVFYNGWFISFFLLFSIRIIVDCFGWRCYINDLPTSVLIVHKCHSVSSNPRMMKCKTSSSL